MATIHHLKSQEPAPAISFDSVFDALPAAVVVLDGGGTVRCHNRAAGAWLGGPLNGESWRAVVGRAFDATATGPDLRLLDGRYLTVATCPVGGQPGQVVMLHDTSEAHRLRERLEKARRLADTGRMAAALAHQVRTPLATALLYGSHLRRPDLNAAKRQQFTDRLLERLHHLDALVEDMLAFARGGQMGKEPFSAGSLVASIVRSLPAEVAETVQVDDGSAGLLVRGNPTLLQSALQNVVNNALRAAGPQGWVRITAQPLRGAVQFFITDSGAGLDQKQQDLLFEPLQSGAPGGTGLGLAVARAIIRAHGGDLWLDSGTPGATVFACRLPARASGGEGEGTP